MKLQVLLAPNEISPGAVLGHVVAMIDVLRASTTIATALANGARSVVPVESAHLAIVHSKQFERSEVLLAGEQKMQPISGFDLGNSPSSFTSEAVSSKTIMLTTTNGTRALTGLIGARDVVVASYVNHSAVAAMLGTAVRSDTNVSIVCAGDEGHFSLEDAACAGRYIRSLSQRHRASIVLNDAACACEIIDRKYGDNIAKIFRDSSHGKALAEAGFGEDLAFCSAVDSQPVVPIYQDRQITRLGPDRER
ncbi:MAG: 2-phosphosulfolactate phosphatase [Gemmatimonadaceae bacterium]